MIIGSAVWLPSIYNQTSLIRTPKRQNQVSALQRCPYHRGRECTIFGISQTKRTVCNIGVHKERLDCNPLPSKKIENLKIFINLLAEKEIYLKPE